MRLLEQFFGMGSQLLYLYDVIGQGAWSQPSAPSPMYLRSLTY